MEDLAIAGNHIKDIDFLIGNTDTLVGEGLDLVSDHNTVKDFTQGIYPLTYVRDMIDQIKNIQESVQVLGMADEERNDWNGVRMQLIRIFQQEQFIFRGDAKTDINFARLGKTLVKRFLFKVNPMIKKDDVFERIAKISQNWQK